MGARDAEAAGRSPSPAPGGPAGAGGSAGGGAGAASYLSGAAAVSAAPRSPFASSQELEREAPGGGTPPRARELAPVLAFVAALQLLALSRIEGYQIADSVEYLDRAEQYSRGEALDPSTVRSFAFSALFVPVFWMSRLLGAEASALPVALARALVMAVGLAAVAVTARIGWRLAGRRAGLVAGFLAGVNPVFLQHSVEPLSDSAAMLCAALGAERLLARGGWRRGLAAGTWLGLGVLVAFKSLLVAGCLFALVALRERWRGRRLLLGTGVAFAAMLLVQCLLDLLVYGRFGTSLLGYLGENVLTQVGAFLYKAGLTDVGKWLYDLAEFEVDDGARVEGTIASKTTWSWYLVHLPAAFLVLPGLLLVALGALRSALRPSWTSAIALGTVVLAAAAMSPKGAKSFRLWLPLLPLIGALGGSGFAALAGTRGAARLARVRTSIGAALLALAAWLGFGVVRATNLEKHGGYWEAVELVEAAAREVGTPVRCGSAYHWAVQYRASADVLLAKLPHHLDAWKRLDETARSEVLAALETYDWFIGHEQAFTQDPALIAAVNARFEIHSAIYHAEAFEQLEPIYVLRARTGNPGARTFFDVLEGVAPDEVAAGLQVPRSVDMRRAFPETGEVDQLVLLGWSVESEAGGELAWLTTAWYAGPIGARDYTLAYRVTDQANRPLFQRNHAPGFGALPTSSWTQASIVRETLLVKVPPRAYRESFGGDYYRGDLVPCELWLAAPEYELTVDPETGETSSVHVGGLNPYHASGRSPIHKLKVDGRVVSDDGRRFSTDGLYLAGGFFLPVPERGRVADDGGPLPEAPPAPR